MSLQVSLIYRLHENIALYVTKSNRAYYLNPLNTELNPNCNLLPLLRAHHILQVSGLRVKARILGTRLEIFYQYLT